MPSATIRSKRIGANTPTRKSRPGPKRSAGRGSPTQRKQSKPLDACFWASVADSSEKSSSSTVTGTSKSTFSYERASPLKLTVLSMTDKDITIKVEIDGSLKSTASAPSGSRTKKSSKPRTKSARQSLWKLGARIKDEGTTLPDEKPLNIR